MKFIPVPNAFTTDPIVCYTVRLDDGTTEERELPMTEFQRRVKKGTILEDDEEFDDGTGS